MDAGVGPDSGFPPSEHAGSVRMGGAAATALESPAPSPTGGAALRTVLREEEAKPVAGWLVVMRATGGSRMAAYTEVPIFEGRNVAGRDPSRGAHCIDDPNASTEHAFIMATNNAVILTDMGSANGTYVNGERVDSATLGRGDRVKLGKTTFVFVPMPAEVAA